MRSPEEADRIAAQLLGGRTDDVGGSLLAHARRVAAAVLGELPSMSDDGEAERAVIAALLHDVLEKTDITVDQLSELTDDERVVEIVLVLTRRAGETDRSYLTRCAGDAIALAIKRSDLRDKLSDVDATASADAVALRARVARRRIHELDEIASARPVPTERDDLVANAASRRDLHDRRSER